MIGIAWLTALKLFVGVWTRALHLSAQLSPTNWDRVVIGCVCLLIASVFWMLSATPSAKVGTPVELQNTQQRPELEKGQQLQSMAQQSTSEQVLKANYSDRSNSKRAGRRAPANRHKTNYLISEAGHRVTVQVRGVVAGASVKPSELNVAAGNSGAKIAAEAALEEKVQTTPAETATNVPSIFNPDEIKASLEQFEAQIDSTSAKAEADAAPSNSLPRYYSAAYIRAKMYVEEFSLNTPDESAIYVDSIDSGMKPAYQSARTEPPRYIKKPWTSARLQYGVTETREDTDTDGLPDSNSAKDDTGGFPAQTWGIFDTEANLDVRDVTSASCMAFASVLVPRSRSIEISPDANNNAIQVNRTWAPKDRSFHSQHTVELVGGWSFDCNGSAGPWRTLSFLGQHSQSAKFDVISDGSLTGFNYEDGVFLGEGFYPGGTLQTVFTHDHAGVRDRRSNSQPQRGMDQTPITEHGATTDKPSSEQLKIHRGGQQQRSRPQFAAAAAPWNPPKPVVPPEDKNFGILFWIFLLNMIMNTLSTTSAIILAWISNNRAKAEFVLKQAQALREQAEALREAKEKDLRIKQLELQLAELERGANRGLIIVSN